MTFLPFKIRSKRSAGSAASRLPLAALLTLSLLALSGCGSADAEPSPTPTKTPSPVATPTDAAIALATQTGIAAATEAARATPTPTMSPVPTATSLPTDTPVPTATETPAAPTDTPLPPTDTPVPPTPLPAQQPTAPPPAAPTNTPAPPVNDPCANIGGDGCKFRLRGGPAFAPNGGTELKLQLHFIHSGVDGGQPQGDYRVWIEKDGQKLAGFDDTTSMALQDQQGTLGKYNYEHKAGIDQLPGNTVAGQYVIWVLDGNRERDSQNFSFAVPDGQGEVWIEFDQG